MTADLDLSPEAVERLAVRLYATPLYEGHGDESVVPELAANALRALAAELEVELAGCVADAHVVAFGAGVLGELVLEAVLTEGALPALPPEVEGAAKVGAGLEVGVALVESRWDAATIEGQEEGKAA